MARRAEGSDLRPRAGDLRRVEDAFWDAWGRPRGNFERFVGITGGENSDPSLWFLAADGEEIAATVLRKTVAGEGWMDVVDVRRSWRGWGLEPALSLRHAFGDYRRRESLR